MSVTSEDITKKINQDNVIPVNTDKHPDMADSVIESAPVDNNQDGMLGSSPSFTPADVPDVPEYTPPEYDSSGMLDAQVSDILSLTDPESDLMKNAATKGKQYANSRGLLNSSMAAGAVQQAQLDAVMPMVQQNAQNRASVDLQSREQGFQGNQAALDRSQQIEMLNLDTASRSYLIDLEQGWNSLMNSNELASEIWQTNVEGLSDVMSAGLTDDQVDGAMEYYFGTDGQSGVFGASMQFAADLYGEDGAPSGSPAQPVQSIIDQGVNGVNGLPVEPPPPAQYQPPAEDQVMRQMWGWSDDQGNVIYGYYDSDGNPRDRTGQLLI